MIRRIIKFFNHYSVPILGTLLQLSFYILFIKNKIIQSDEEYKLGVIFVISSLGFFLLWQIGTSFIKTKAFRLGLNLGILFFICILLSYQLARGAPLDFALVYTNFSEMLTWSGIVTILSEGTLLGWLSIFSALVILFEAGRRFDFLASRSRPKKWISFLIVLIPLNIFFLVDLKKNPNQIFTFSRSIYNHFRDPEDALLPYLDSPVNYPFERVFESSNRFLKKPKIVFILLIESFSSAYIEKKLSDGREITPVFNDLIKNSLYFDRFYSNSMQTERAMSAIICSLIPSYRRKIMTDYHQNNFKCLPEITKTADYDSYLFRAHWNLKFDNTGDFMKKIGFDHIIAMQKSDFDQDYQKYFWGWGLQDDKLYEQVFKRINADLGSNQKPKVVIISTASNHQGFNDMPDGQRYLFPSPENFEQIYLNSIHLADKYLRRFFEILEAHPDYEDTLTIVMGDHGFPSGRWGNESNEITFHDELFHVPLIIRWPRYIKPNRITDIAFSQLDLLPTLTDWLGISTKAHFTGSPLPINQMEAEHRVAPIPLIQPYDGVFLGGLLYPYKYVRSLALETDALYNIKTDPLEKNNIIKRRDLAPTISVLKDEVRRIYMNQRMLDQNRIFSVK